MQSSKFQLALIGTFAALTIIGVLIFALGGRGGSKNQVNILVWGTLPQPIFAEVWATSPSVKEGLVKVSYEEKSEEAFDRDFVEALAEGVGPDLIFLPNDKIMSNKNKLLVIPYESLSERVFRDTFVEGAETLMFSDGVLALPLLVDPLVMYWNRDILSSASVTTPPAYWDEYYKFSEQITTKDGAFNITKSAVALGEYRNIKHAKEILSALIMQAGNPITQLQVSEVVGVLRERFNSPVGPTQAALTFYTEFSNPAKPFYSWNRSLPNSETSFLSGDLAVYFGFASEYAVLKLKNPNLNFDVAHLPQSRSAERKTTYGKMTSIAIVRNSKNVGPAFSVAMELVGKNMAKTFSTNLSAAPARRDLLSARPTDALGPVAYESALWSRFWLDPNSKETERIFQNMVESVTGGRVKIDAAVNQASVELENLFKK